MDRPAISVIVPTYNRAALLSAALRSVQAQTFTDWEAIVVDDGSTDSTRDVFKTFAQNDRRLKLIENRGAPGPAGARNTAIRAASGSAIAFLDSDDEWEPTKLARFLGRLDASSHTVLVASDYRIVDRGRSHTTTMKSDLFNTMIPWWRSDPRFGAVTHYATLLEDIGSLAEAGRFLSLTIAGFPWIHTSSVMVRREAVMAAGSFDESLARTEDIDLWLKLERQGGFAYIDDVLATYDITGREGGVGARYQSYEASRRHTGYAEARHHLKLLERIERSHSLTPEQIELLQWRRMAQQRNCAVAARREHRWAWVLHAARCLGNRSERKALARQLRAARRRPAVHQ